jgi:hypothetical protein
LVHETTLLVFSTDLKKQTCQFQLANKDLDLKAKLDELAQGHEHLKVFEIVSQ